MARWAHRPCRVRARWPGTPPAAGRVEPVDGRHPAVDLPVVPAADRLDWLPDLLGGYDGDSGVVGLRGDRLVTPCFSMAGGQAPARGACPPSVTMRVLPLRQLRRNLIEMDTQA